MYIFLIIFVINLLQTNEIFAIETVDVQKFIFCLKKGFFFFISGGGFFNFSILFNFIPFSDYFLRYLGKTRNFFIKTVKKYEFFTAGGSLTLVGFNISLVNKFLKNSQLFFHQMEAFWGVSPQIKRT